MTFCEEAQSMVRQTLPRPIWFQELLANNRMDPCLDHQSIRKYDKVHP